MADLHTATNQRDRLEAEYERRATEHRVLASKFENKARALRQEAPAYPLSEHWKSEAAKDGINL